MLTASVILLNILLLIFIIITLRQRKHESDDTRATEIELEMDLDKLSKAHYLLEAGKNEWRLNEKQYNDPHALIIYALGLLFNNPIIYFNSEKLHMTQNRIRLHYLLEQYTDSDLELETRVQNLVDKFFEQRDTLESNLQELYNLPSQEENILSNNLIDTLNLILKH